MTVRVSDELLFNHIGKFTGAVLDDQSPSWT